jgi:hypothetical protein
VDDVESYVHSLNPELIAELSATARRRKLGKDEERKAVNHKYFTRTASERGVKTRGMEKKIAEAENVEDSIDQEYLDYLNKLRESYDSGFQNSLNDRDTLPGSDTEEVPSTQEVPITQEVPVIANHIQTSLTGSPSQTANTKESTPASQPDINSSNSKTAIVLDVENNPFTAIIENETEVATENSQGGAETHPNSNHNDAPELPQEEIPSGNLFSM